MARRLLIGLMLPLLLSCHREAGAPAPAASGSSLAGGDDLRLLIAQGQADAALARLQSADQTSGEVMYLQGLAWAKKAETAPAPTAEPPASPVARGARPAPVPVLKPEEHKALGLFEKAVAARPDLAAAHVAIADLLAPHALRQAEHERAAARGRARGNGRRPEEEGPEAGDGDGISVDRVLGAYRLAAQADLTSKPVVEAWIEFARRADRPVEAEAGFHELLKRDKESAAPFVRYGDFLLVDRKDDVGAIVQYAQALIWRPDDEETRGKIADIYLNQAAAHFDKKEYASAEARLGDAKKYVGRGGSPSAIRLQQQLARLAQIRGR